MEVDQQHCNTFTVLATKFVNRNGETDMVLCCIRCSDGQKLVHRKSTSRINFSFRGEAKTVPWIRDVFWPLKMRIYIIVHIPWGDSGELVFPTLHMIQTKLFHNFNIEDKICLSGSGVDNHCIVHTTIIVDKTMKMKKKLFSFWCCRYLKVQFQSVMSNTDDS